VQADMKIMNTLLILVLTNVLSCIVYINIFKVYCIIYSCTFFSGHGFHKFCCPLRECILCMDFNWTQHSVLQFVAAVWRMIWATPLRVNSGTVEPLKTDYGWDQKNRHFRSAYWYRKYKILISWTGRLIMLWLCYLCMVFFYILSMYYICVL
jgi:hypothetical protein